MITSQKWRDRKRVVSAFSYCTLLISGNKRPFIGRENFVFHLAVLKPLPSNIFFLNAVQLKLISGRQVIPSDAWEHGKIAWENSSNTRVFRIATKLLKQRNSVYSLRGSNKLNTTPDPRTDILRKLCHIQSIIYYGNNLKRTVQTTVSDF